MLAEAVALAAERGVACGYERVVEDGSAGPAERVTELLARHILPGDRVAVCGPEAMARAVWLICSSVRDVKCVVQPRDQHGVRRRFLPRVRNSPWPTAPMPGCAERGRSSRARRSSVTDLAVQLGPLRLAYPLINASGTMELFDLAAAGDEEVLAEPPVAAYVPKTITLLAQGRQPASAHPGDDRRHDQCHRSARRGPGGFRRRGDATLLALPCPLILSIGGFSVSEYVTLAKGLRDALDEMVGEGWTAASAWSSTSRARTCTQGAPP